MERFYQDTEEFSSLKRTNESSGLKHQLRLSEACASERWQGRGEEGRGVGQSHRALGRLQQGHNIVRSGLWSKQSQGGGHRPRKSLLAAVTSELRDWGVLSSRAGLAAVAGYLKNLFLVVV